MTCGDGDNPKRARARLAVIVEDEVELVELVRAEVGDNDDLLCHSAGKFIDPDTSDLECTLKAKGLFFIIYATDPLYIKVKNVTNSNVVI